MSASIEQSARESIIAKNPRNYIALNLALGIAKLHAHIGITSSSDDPHSGQWTWGDNAIYTLR
ncbi:hypothetical protein EJ419_08180 [Alloscardovia theropitheci]|uniref:Uncharacterized protein n=1 Tax=Alloscardovia theropitheci TaxID=2496842 RepID=A0A4R0QUF0_9BIFI|nr:hypothetical protein [Alloscardovia theropitheci]TCD53607.1 hypothetical protein EJ419_08180 [Alloscardovia theropitheci]